MDEETGTLSPPHAATIWHSPDLSSVEVVFGREAGQSIVKLAQIFAGEDLICDLETGFLADDREVTLAPAQYHWLITITSPSGAPVAHIAYRGVFKVTRSASLDR